MKRKLIALLMIVVFLISAVNTVYAEELTPLSRRGIIVTKSNDLNIRSGPGTGYDLVGTVARSSIVNVIGSITGTDGFLWYKISTGSVSGYGRSDYIQLVEESGGSDSDFETDISAFPESYKQGLRELHALYPSWRFTALVTEISWDTLMENECKTGRNLITSPEAWLSYEKDANYRDESSGEYVWHVFDSGGWKQACNEAIAYYLDPRNFLDGNIFQFMVLSNDGDSVSEETINQILDGTFMHDAECQEGLTYAAALIQAADEAGASPYMLAARIKLEQGSVGNALAHGTVSGYEGYYNFFDIGAYSHDNRSAMENGAIYAANSKRNWDTPYKAILGGAQFLVRNYIGVGQNTLYLQKYDVTDGGNGYYNHQYMTNISAAVEECRSLRDAILDSSAKDTALTFLIPVYTDMPEEKCAKPLTTGNGNNLLKALDVGGVVFNEAFDTYTQEYELTVSQNRITVYATADDSSATVSGTGEYSLSLGTNEITVTVTASNGNVREYTLFISCNDNTLVSDSYLVEKDYISDIYGSTTVDTFLSNITADGSVYVRDSNGNGKSGGEIIQTGDEVVVDNGEAREFLLIISGDSTGDGKLSSKDLLRTQKHILDISPITDKAQLLAADFNNDGSITSRDLLAGQKRILNSM